MSEPSVKSAIARAIRHAEYFIFGQNQVVPRISDASAKKIANAVGDSIDDGEREAIMKFMHTCEVSEKGSFSLSRALTLPRDP